MNYPVWNLPFLGAGLVVAIIAIIHVLISHIAVGGGAFLFAAELWSDRQPDGEKLRAWLHRFATFFLVFTTVFGAITGVGIWFSIQLASPEGTSLLIHQFVFAWATEWVTFIGELTVLYLYYYGWKSNSRALQRTLAVLYFVIAWLSLFIINGVLTFMLTPGQWTLENRDLAAGFFNPTYLPALFIRTLLMFVVAGLTGILVASRVRDDDSLKERVVVFSARWVLPAALLMPLCVWWFWQAMPASSAALYQGGAVGVAGGRMEAMHRYFWLAVASGATILVGVLVVLLRPRAVSTGAATALLVTALLGIGGAEFFREMARKPYVINGVLYSNSRWRAVSRRPLQEDGPYLREARWAPPAARQGHGRGKWIYRLQCASCHTLDGYRSLKVRTAAWTPSFGVSFLERLDQQKVMPPFQGDRDDRVALTAYLPSLHGEQVLAGEVSAALAEEAAKTPPAPSVPQEVRP